MASPAFPVSSGPTGKAAQTPRPSGRRRGQVWAQKSKQSDGNNLLYILKGIQDSAGMKSTEREVQGMMDSLGGPAWRKDAEEEELSLPEIPSEEEVERKALEAVNKLYSAEALSKLVEEKLMAPYDVKVPSRKMPGVRPRFPRITLDHLSYLAKQAMRRQNYTEALRIYRECIESDPSDGRAYVGIGRIELRRANTTGARLIYEQGLKYCFDNPYLLQAYGVLEQRQGNFPRAMALYNEAINADPNHGASWLAKAQLLWELGKKKESRDNFRKAVETNMDNEVLWHAWGMAEKRDGNFKVARKLLRRATEVNPRNSHCWHAWAVMEVELGNQDLAVDLFQNALKAFPNSSHTYQAWACLEKERGAWDLALRLFRTAIDKRPWDGGAYQAYALALRQRGYVNKALEIFKLGVEADPYHCPLYQAWGLTVSEILGDYDKARRIFESCVNTNPNGKSVYYIWHAWAMLEFRTGNHKAARTFFKNALAMKPRSIEILSASALLEEADGQFEAAREVYERALKIDPRADCIWQLYEEMEKRLGNADRARRIDERRVLARQISQGDARAAVSERLQQSTKASADKAQGEVQKLFRAVKSKSKEIGLELDDVDINMDASAQQVLYGTFGLKPRKWDQTPGQGLNLASS